MASPLLLSPARLPPKPSSSTRPCPRGAPDADSQGLSERERTTTTTARLVEDEEERARVEVAAAAAEAFNPEDTTQRVIMSQVLANDDGGPGGVSCLGVL